MIISNWIEYPSLAIYFNTNIKNVEVYDIGNDEYLELINDLS